MRTPCVNTIMLNRHLDQLDADEAHSRFVEEYCIDNLNDKVNELLADEAEWETSAVVDAVLEDHDHVDTYFSQALHEYQHQSDEAKNEALSIALENLGRAVFTAGREALEKIANDRLEDDAESAWERQQERANCSCRRTGRECVC